MKAPRQAPICFDDGRNTLTLADSLESMPDLPDQSFDIAIVDPPYNASKGNVWKWDNSAPLPGMGGNWNKVQEDWDNQSLDRYLSFTFQWLTQIKRLVK